MKPTYRNHTPRAALAVLAVAVTALIGLSIEGLAHYMSSHAAQASLPQPQLIALAKK